MAKTIIKDFAIKLDIAIIEEDEKEKFYSKSVSKNHTSHMAECMKEIGDIENVEKRQLRILAINMIYLDFFSKLACKHMALITDDDEQAEILLKNATNLIRELVTKYRKNLKNGSFEE